MRRRNLIAGVGAVLSSGGLILGSGAFSSTQATRNMEVTVAQDDESYLYLDPQEVNYGDGVLGRSVDPGKTVEFHVPGTINEDESLGIGPNSTYLFQDLLEIRNYGTNTVEIYSTYESNELEDVRLVHDKSVLRESNRSKAVSPGNSLKDVGLLLRTGSEPLGNIETDILINAEEP